MPLSDLERELLQLKSDQLRHEAICSERWEAAFSALKEIRESQKSHDQRLDAFDQYANMGKGALKVLMMIGGAAGMIWAVAEFFVKLTLRA